MARHKSIARPELADTTTAAITCTDLTKDYGNGNGLFDLNLSVARGETFGFIGPNGAGKTTTIRLLMDLIRPDRGSAPLLGLDSRRDGLAVKQRVGYLPGELVQFPGATAGYLIGLLAGVRGGSTRPASPPSPSDSTWTWAAGTRPSRTATSRRSG